MYGQSYTTDFEKTSSSTLERNMNATYLATPRMEYDGIEDNSTRAQLAQAEVRPTHFPLSMFYSAWGPDYMQAAVGALRTTLYHEDSFVENSKFATHATVLSNRINATGNTQMHWRMIPKDAGPKSSLRLWLDLLPTMKTVWARNRDGSYMLNEDGVKIDTGERIPGFIGKWVVSEVQPDTFGLATEKPGSQSDAQNNTSIMYPWMDFEVPHFGAHGRNFGISMWTRQTSGEDSFDERLLTNEKFYPFSIAMVSRRNELSTGKAVTSLTGANSIELSFKPDAFDRNTRTRMYVGENLIDKYQNLQDPLNPRFGPFGKMHVYSDVISIVLTSLYQAEAPYVTESHDFTGSDVEEEKYMYNVISGHTANGRPYESLDLDYSGRDVVRMSQNAMFFARGGSDGTMNDELFAELVEEAMQEFENPASPYAIDDVRYPVSILYDSGFPLSTKYALCKFIALRKDTAVVLSTYDTLGTRLTAAQESSLAVALRTRLQLYPESTYHGTPVCRGMVVGRNGKLIGSEYRGRLPLTIEIATKAARYMGAGDGVWKGQYSFDRGEMSRVTDFTDVNVTFTPADVRNADWSNGLVWVESFSQRDLFFPAMKTVYSDDTSILNSFFNMMGCIEMVKVARKAFVMFVGSDKLTNSEFKKAQEDFIAQDVKGRFDNRFVITPTVFYTAADTAAGFRWSTRINFKGPNQKTVMSLGIDTERRED